MPFLKKNISFSYFISAFIFSSLMMFSFSFQETAFASFTASQCGALSTGSSCKPTTPGCDDLGASATEITKGYCREAGDTTSTTLACCQKKPYCVVPPNNCGTCSVYQAPVSGYICPGSGETCCGPIACNTGGVCKGSGLCNTATETKESSPACTGGLDCCVPKVPVVGSCNDLSAGEVCVETYSGCDPATKEKKISGDAYCRSVDATHQYCCQKKTVSPGSTPCTSITPSPTPPGCCGGTAGAPACTGTPVPGASASIPFTNPIGGANNSTVEGVVGSISVVLQSIIVVLALVFIVIGAVIYVTSAGNDERMKTAKGAITAAMIGLALAIAAPSFLKQIASVLGWNTTEASLTGAKTLTALALSVLQFLLSVVGILGIIMLVIGGMAYLTSAGDEERAGTGKKIVTYAIIGIAVALASLIIVTQVAKLFV